jgi:hypothetical protein
MAQLAHIPERHPSSSTSCHDARARPLLAPLRLRSLCIALFSCPQRRTKVRTSFAAIVLNERPMGRFVVERIFATLLFVLGGAGLLVAVALTLREGTWVSSADVSTSGLGWWRVATVALGLAWFALFWGVGLVLELLVELCHRDRSSS